MKVYSLYLSTLTGCNVQSTFTGILYQQAVITSAIATTNSTTLTLSATATIQPGSILYIASSATSTTYQNQAFTVISGTTIGTTIVINTPVTLEASTKLFIVQPTSTVQTNTLYITNLTTGTTPVSTQLLVVNGQVNQASVVANSIIILAQLTQQSVSNTFIAYTNATQSFKYAPSNKYLGQSMAAMKFNVNWREIFGARTAGDVRVRATLTSAASNMSGTRNLGSIHMSLESNSSNMNSGLNLGCIRPQNDSLAGGSQYLGFDSSQGNGITAIIPNTSQELYIQIQNNFDLLMSNVPEYQLWLYFDADDESPNEMSDMEMDHSRFHAPR